MQRKILFRPAWDKSNPDPNKDYGVSDLGIFFVVYDDNNRYVSFEISTNWYQQHIMDKRVEAVKRDVYLIKENFLLMRWIAPYPIDVFYISPTRLFVDDCYWESGYSVFGVDYPCYYGYRYEKEEDEHWTTDYLYWKLISEGDEPVWKWLENYFVETFGEHENSNHNPIPE